MQQPDTSFAEIAPKIYFPYTGNKHIPVTYTLKAISSKKFEISLVRKIEIAIILAYIYIRNK